LFKVAMLPAQESERGQFAFGCALRLFGGKPIVRDGIFGKVAPNVGKTKSGGHSNGTIVCHRT
jgi:hypothetical protein